MGANEQRIWQEAMGMPWAKKDELSQAIPPAYTEFLGEQLMLVLDTGEGIPTLQTFLPHPNFACSALVLDRQRLGKQRLECRQILQALAHGGGWRNHPAVKMWAGHAPALQLYHDVVIREWVRRGYACTMPELLPPPSSIVMPAWLGRGDFHSSHRAMLLGKDPGWYGQFGWDETPGGQYVWPA